MPSLYRPSTDGLITAIAEKHSSCDGAFFSHGTTSYRPGPVVSHTLRNQLEMCWLSRLDLPSPHTVLVPPSSCAACSYTVITLACCHAISLLFLHLIIGHVALSMVKLVYVSDNFCIDNKVLTRSCTSYMVWEDMTPTTIKCLFACFSCSFLSSTFQLQQLSPLHLLYSWCIHLLQSCSTMGNLLQIRNSNEHEYVYCNNGMFVSQ